MRLDCTPEQEQLRDEIRATMEQVMTPERRVAVISTFGGGANEIQRDIIAMAGLGMPRAPRDLRATDKSGVSTQ